MLNGLLELLCIVTFVGFAVIAWALLGRAARSLGVSRLTLLGGVAMLGWLIG